MKTIKINKLEEIERAAADFVDYISKSDMESNIFAFYGQMGAGKTTFITAVCKALGVSDTVNSPTFTIVNEYKSGKGFPVYHFDFYRINKIQEAYDIGIDEYFGGNGLCLIEWPEKIDRILPPDCIRVEIVVDKDGSRSLNIN
ncbi:MAG: tRNA (adenosine(37)-N6)-threonylcarbamoyltransferase complex ATPase subunit type 1 TsaE [Bacteroidales bacterium]